MASVRAASRALAAAWRPFRSSNLRQLGRRGGPMSSGPYERPMRIPWPMLIEPQVLND
jgi:hypothetical protein